MKFGAGGCQLVRTRPIKLDMALFLLRILPSITVLNETDPDELHDGKTGTVNPFNAILRRGHTFYMQLSWCMKASFKRLLLNHTIY